MSSMTKSVDEYNVQFRTFCRIMRIGMNSVPSQISFYSSSNRSTYDLMISHTKLIMVDIIRVSQYSIKKCCKLKTGQNSLILIHNPNSVLFDDVNSSHIPIRPPLFSADLHIVTSRFIFQSIIQYLHVKKSSCYRMQQLTGILIFYYKFFL